MFSAEDGYLKSLGDLHHWRLRCRCGGCGHIKLLKIDRVIQAQGAEHTLRSLLDRLNCRECRGKPAAVALTNTDFYEPEELWRDIELHDGRRQLVLWDHARPE